MKIKSILISIALITFCKTITYAQEEQIIDRVVAVVGQNIILQSDIEEQYKQYRLHGGIKGSARSIRCKILEDMLFQKLLLNQAELDSIEVTPEQIENEMNQTIKYYVAQLGSEENLEKMYNKTMLEIKEEMRKFLREKYLSEQVQAKIVEGVSPTPADVREYFRSIPQDSIPMVNSKYEIAELVKKPPITLDEKLAVKDKLYQLRARILKGDRFSTMALLYSEDPGSAKKGGELGFHGKGEFAPEFEATAFTLKEGEISEVIETEFGFHILQLIERRGDYVNVRHILMTVKVSPEALQKAYEELDSIANLIRNDSMTFDVAVKKFSDEDNKVSGGILVNETTGGTLFEPEELDQQVAGVINYLKVGEVSHPVPMKTKKDKDAYRLLIIKRKTQAHRANLNDDYSMIQQWTMQKKREEAINKWIKSKSNKSYVKICDEFCVCDFQFDWSVSK